MKRAVLIVVLAFDALAACTGTREPVEVTVLDHYYEYSWGGCVATDWHTRVVDEHGHAETWCGKLGNPGMKLRGYWISGNWLDGTPTGLRPQ